MLTVCKEIVVFLVLAKMLESFQNGSKYGRFVKLIISLIVVLKIITPVFSLFDKEFDLEKISAQIEQRFVVESETIEMSETVLEVESIEITKPAINVEEIKWEK